MNEALPAIGRRIVRVDSVGSTNTLAADIAREPDSHGIVVVAREQTAGRGQYGRTWISQPEESLLLSIILRPPPELHRPVILTAWAATAIADTVFEVTGVQARMKWPNDLLVDGRKISGILIESANETIVVGIGLNLSQSREFLDRAGLTEATSLAIISYYRVTPPRVFDLLLRSLNSRWERLMMGNYASIEADWKNRMGLQSHPILAEHYDGSTITGRLHDMSFEGIEIIRDTGAVEVLTPETIRHIRVL